MPAQLTDEQRQALREQFIDAHAQSQDSYDSSVRALAAGGVGVTASLAVALQTLGGAGKAAVAVFLFSLSANLLSYATVQMDMRRRVNLLGSGRDDEIERTRWTTATVVLNWAAGLALIAGGGLLASFVASTA